MFFLLEVCLGGSGRLFEFGGGLTLRKINFIISLFMSLSLVFYFKKIEKYAAFIFILFSVSMLIAAIIGSINYGRDERVVENVLMQSFFLLLPFYCFFITDEAHIKTVSSIVKFASLLMAVIYLLIIGLIAADVLSFITVYGMIENSLEFMGRGESGFWFKGFLYLCIGIFFFDTEESVMLKRIKELVILIAIYFTFVRGFIVALLVTVFLHQLFFKSLLKSALILILSLVIIVLFSPYYEAASFDRSESDVVRKIQFKQVMSGMNPASVFIGNGFGKGVPIRENHFEINYLEIFYKQGIIGLVFWFALLAYVFYLYINCRRHGYERKARPFFQSVLFVYLQSATNPYLTNSIGLNVLMISIVSLNIYLKNGRESLGSNSNI